MDSHEPASTALRRGRFREAFDLQRGRMSETDAQPIARAELLYYLATRVMRLGSPSRSCAARQFLTI